MADKTQEFRSLLASMKERAEIAGARTEDGRSLSDMREKLYSQNDVPVLIAVVEAALAVEPASTDRDLTDYVVFQNEGYNQGLRDVHLAMAKVMHEHPRGTPDA